MSDDPMTQPAEETNTTDKTQIMLVALVVLAVVASVVMLFSNSAAAMKVAVLAALWAAFLGLFLVAKYRRIATEERARAEEEREKLAAELRAEQAELAAENAISASAQDTELLQDIRAQLGELRQQLEELSGREFGYEPATLTAEASRIRELETATDEALTETIPTVEEPPVEATVEPSDDTSGASRFDTGSFATVKLDTPAAVPTPEPESHGRRRRDENKDSISVAELLANLKKNK
ncbi:DUF6779 domain-containing protein [Corynebacterium hindlerae]|uniref:DUF6779 domain-containing protein n=1 Tax=Corynebacterium hindlerae TaxID=699041 RepID=UPI001FCAF1F2|nr:DUF6779 domain-containing protein [Corynebacterium hindlerae]